MHANRGVTEDFCPVCGTQHDLPPSCPGELRATGPERHGWAIAVDAPRGIELYGVIVAPTNGVWRARVVTYPHSTWTIPGGRGTLKFVGPTAAEVEAKALQFVLRWCTDHNRNPRDGFGPWDHTGGPGYRRPPPRKRRSIPIRFGLDGKMTLMTTHDLSPGGMFVTALEPYHEGTVLDLEMEIYGCVAQMRGVVVWKRDKMEPGRPRGMGVRLLDPPPVYKLFVRGLP